MTRSWYLMKKVSEITIKILNTWVTLWFSKPYKDDSIKNPRLQTMFVQKSLFLFWINLTFIQTTNKDNQQQQQKSAYPKRDSANSFQNFNLFNGNSLLTIHYIFYTNVENFRSVIFYSWYLIQQEMRTLSPPFHQKYYYNQQKIFRNIFIS